MTDSVFLVVDSDADDLAAFVGALTSRYASEYEIRAAATASEAHETLAALSVAGATVALLIVSRDLGDADVLLLLQRALELFPGARRVLSALYLDPSAFDFITGALRTGRIDYFLRKCLSGRVVVLNWCWLAKRQPPRRPAFRVGGCDVGSAAASGVVRELATACLGTVGRCGELDRPKSTRCARSLPQPGTCCPPDLVLIRQNLSLRKQFFLAAAAQAHSVSVPRSHRLPPVV